MAWDTANRDTDAHSGQDTATKTRAGRQQTHYRPAAALVRPNAHQSTWPDTQEQTHKSDHIESQTAEAWPAAKSRTRRHQCSAQSARRRPATFGVGNQRSHAIRARFSGGSTRYTCPDWGGGAGAGAGADAAAANMSPVDDDSASSAVSKIFLTFEILFHAGCA